MKRYDVTDLGSLGGPSGSAFGINNRPQAEAVGRSSYVTGSNEHAFLCSGGPMEDMEVVGQIVVADSVATDISDESKVVGTVNDSNRQAFMYDNGLFIDLNQRLSSSVSMATSIAGDRVVGGAVFDSTKPASFTQAFVFDTVTNAVINIGSLLMRDISMAMAVNDSGQVVGGARNAWEYSHPFLYDNGQIIDLTPNSVGTAWAINNEGLVVGTSTAQGAFIYSNSNRKVHYLNVNGLAYGINDERQVIGSFGPGAGAWRWTPDDGVIDLNNLISPTSGWILTHAFAINQQGQIVGRGIRMTGEETLGRAYLLTPTMDEATPRTVLAVPKDVAVPVD